MRRVRRNRFQQSADINITAFMNLMVILVPFLLITTVFSRLVILELDLPAAKEKGAQPKQTVPQFHLEITVRQGRLEIGGTGDKTVVLKNKGQHYNLSGLREILQGIKARFPDKTAASILIEDDIPYDSIIKVMDIVRVVQVRSGEELLRAELFPDISIGDAVVLQGGSPTANKTAVDS